MKWVEEFAVVGGTHARFHLRWTRKKLMTLSWRWNVSDTIGEKSGSGITTLVESLSGRPGQIFVTDQKVSLSYVWGGRAGKLVNLATGKEYKTRFLVLQIQYENSIMESSFLWQPCFWSPISWIAAIPCLKMSNTIVFCCQNVINCHSIHFYPKRNEVENQSKIEFPQIQF